MPLVDRLKLPLWAAVAGSCAAGLAVELWHHLSATNLGDALLPRLSLSYEGNLPTWLSASLLLTCAITAGAIASTPTIAMRRSWWVVATAFGWASLDEAAELHESLGGMVGTGGAFYFDWVIPAVVVLLALVLALWPWFRGLPRVTQWRLMIAGGIYFGGALVMELPLGWWTERAGPDTLGYALIDWVEETMELAGTVLMLVALLAHRDLLEPTPETSAAAAAATARKPSP